MRTLLLTFGAAALALFTQARVRFVTRAEGIAKRVRALQKFVTTVETFCANQGQEDAGAIRAVTSEVDPGLKELIAEIASSRLGLGKWHSSLETSLRVLGENRVLLKRDPDPRGGNARDLQRAAAHELGADLGRLHTFLLS
jgi:hypothetical protein